MPWDANVTTTCTFDSIEDQVRKKVNEIAVDQGRASHGKVMFTNQDKFDHWRAGDYRIFGTFANGVFTFVGYGMHTGKGDTQYKVTLCAGGTTKATTS
jgi:hypothetical protein